MNTVLLCFILIVISFIFSASEIGIFSLSRLQLRHIKERSETLFNRIRKLVQDSIGLLITVLLFNELVNIALGTIITSTWVETLPFGWKTKTILGVLITTPITLIFCELTPKVVATRSNLAVVSLLTPVIYFCYRLTQPLVSIIKLFLPKQQSTQDLRQLQEEDFLIIAEEHTETGHLHETELELIKNVFQMDDMRVGQIILPIKKLATLPATITVEAAAKLALKGKVYSRIPITGRTKNEILGVLSTKDLVELRVNPEIRNDSIMVLAKEPLFVSDQLSIESLFRKMKSKKVQAAFVRNQQGVTIGMVTLNDILDIVIEEAFEE